MCAADEQTADQLLRLNIVVKLLVINFLVNFCPSLTKNCISVLNVSMCV